MTILLYQILIRQNNNSCDHFISTKGNKYWNIIIIQLNKNKKAKRNGLVYSKEKKP